MSAVEAQLNVNVAIGLAPQAIDNPGDRDAAVLHVKPERQVDRAGPALADRGDNPYQAYWQRYSFGDLSQTAVIRREALARLVPQLKIASRLELTGRYLRVRGKLNTYMIHIGSGNVLIEPDDRYLCIVPASGRSKIMLPFDGDNVLSIIVSKAMMLAADDKITDPTIISQLGGRDGTSVMHPERAICVLLAGPQPACVGESSSKPRCHERPAAKVRTCTRRWC